MENYLSSSPSKKIGDSVNELELCQNRNRRRMLLGNITGEVMNNPKGTRNTELEHHEKGKKTVIMLQTSLICSNKKEPTSRKVSSSDLGAVSVT